VLRFSLTAFRDRCYGQPGAADAAFAALRTSHPSPAILVRETPVIGHFDQTFLQFIQHIYTVIGWPGVVVLMAIESAAIPIPSEIIMPLAGWFLIRSQGLPLSWLIAAALLGALGNTLGSLVTYWIGAAGGRPLLERYGRYVLISRHDLDQADHWFDRYGGLAVFIGRLLPVVRTFISLPAGVSRMNLRTFTLLTAAGSFLWSLWLVSAGYALGANFDRLRQMGAWFDIAVGGAIAVVVAMYIVRHVRARGLAA
jgi:membrane protein DedA with SNARE-associated domain